MASDLMPEYMQTKLIDILILSLHITCLELSCYWKTKN